MLMSASRKAMKQRQEAGVRAAQMKKTLKRIDNGLSDQQEQDNYETDKSQNSQSNGKTDPDEMGDLNIGY